MLRKHPIFCSPKFVHYHFFCWFTFHSPHRGLTCKVCKRRLQEMQPVPRPRLPSPWLSACSLGAQLQALVTFTQGLSLATGAHHVHTGQDGSTALSGSPPPRTGGSCYISIPAPSPSDGKTWLPEYILGSQNSPVKWDVVAHNRNSHKASFNVFLPSPVSFPRTSQSFLRSPPKPTICTYTLITASGEPS